ncbi:MAG: cell wall hydrolase, partial [Mesorhizobium sp.]
SSPVAQALARNQFQGQSTKIGPDARNVASQLISGQLPDVAGNALYYANPGASTASWARNLNSSNAMKIGNHYFTDNAKGVPFAAPSPYA